MGLRVWWACAAVLLVPARGAGAEPAMSVEVRPSGPLVAGARADLVVEVRAPHDAPLLVTVRALGEAVEVLRGRLLGRDGKPQEGGARRFEVPLRARAAGSAELRVSLDGYACDPRCHDVHDEVRLVVDVRAL